MSVEAFVDRRFSAKSIALIAQANDIIREYVAAGFTLTLRQLYYQFVARGLLENKQTNYDNLGSVIADARNAGLIDWDAIEDRTRFLRGHQTYKDPTQAIEHLAKRYRIDMWQGQRRRVEVWIEKDALLGVVEPICQKYDVNYFACRGYASQSELYAAGKRMLWRWRESDQQTLVLHLGDHDPSGIDMTRDNEERLRLYSGLHIEVRRIALNYDQVQQYTPPPNPAKLTDSRAGAYVQLHGYESWELDALEPRVIADLIEQDILGEIEPQPWGEREELFQEGLAKLQKAAAYVKRAKV
jgi:hypothetical protein